MQAQQNVSDARICELSAQVNSLARENAKLLEKSTEQEGQITALHQANVSMFKTVINIVTNAHGNGDNSGNIVHVDNEGVYYGQSRNGATRSGIGTIEYFEGSSYHGQWEKHHLVGTGTITNWKHFTKLNAEKAGEYTGEIKDGKRHGKGIVKYEDGSYYDGEWDNNIYHGQGTLKTSAGTYTGAFKNGKKNGYGTLTNKTIFAGTWKNNKPIEGTLTSNGVHFTGTLDDQGRLSGNVLCTYKNNKFILKNDLEVNSQHVKFEGKWIQGKPFGTGTYTWDVYSSDKHFQASSQGVWINEKTPPHPAETLTFFEISNAK